MLAVPIDAGARFCQYQTEQWSWSGGNPGIGAGAMRATRIFAALGFGLTLLVSGYAWAQEDWPMYGRDLLHTFSNIKSQINPGNVANLKPLWAFFTADAISASPTVMEGVIYVGSWMVFSM